MGPESQTQAVDWEDARLVARLMRGLAGTAVLGGYRATEGYDALKDTFGIWTATVNATTVDMTCGTLTASQSNVPPHSDGSMLLSNVGRIRKRCSRCFWCPCVRCCWRLGDLTAD
jgi:hypothetical protein